MWWYYSSNQRLITEAGSLLFFIMNWCCTWSTQRVYTPHNELVLYLEYISVFTLLIGQYLNYNLKLKHQLILDQDIVCICLKFVYI